MSAGIRQKAYITDKTELAPDIISMVLKVKLCRAALPGQFVLVYTGDGARLLGRPLCIADADGDTVRIVFRRVGEGTARIAESRVGDTLFVEGPLGNGYPVEGILEGGHSIALLGGGLGAPSLLYLARHLSAGRVERECRAFLGYKDSTLKHFLADEFERLGMDTIISTDDGSEGTKGNVLDALKGTGKKPDLIYACGPLPMLSAVRKYAGDNDIKAYISLEEHMACGVGVCLGCVVKTVHKDEHSRVNNARVCTEGPVFDAKEVDI